MNYIAHLHLAMVSNTSLMGNFLGDFIKGSQLAQLPEEIHLGVRLHRKVDGFTDRHPLVMQLKSAFPDQLRRVAGIVLDIYFDHLLLLNWRQFTATPAEQTFKAFYAELKDYSFPVNPAFAKTRVGLLQHRWLNDYKREQTCLRAYTAIERRLNGKILFAEQADRYMRNNREVMKRSFLAFYPQLIEFTQHTALELQQYKESPWQ